MGRSLILKLVAFEYNCSISIFDNKKSIVVTGTGFIYVFLCPLNDRN